jgi:hypothetical protein
VRHDETEQLAIAEVTMSILSAVRTRLSVKISLTLAAVLLVLTALAATLITFHETRQMER